MATSEQIRKRIEEVTRQLAEEFGDIDESQGSCWLDAIEQRAVEIGDAISVSLAEKMASQQASQEEAICPACGELGRYRGPRERELLGRRGKIQIEEPEYYCACCRKSFFPDDESDRR